MTYEPPLTSHESVALFPGDTVSALVAKLLIVGGAACGTLDAVYTGFICTTSNAEAGT
jgi:spermidine synthase